jgi:hypothetical protein
MDERSIFVAGVYVEMFRLSTGIGGNVNFFGTDETILKDYRMICRGNSNSKSKMILMRLGANVGRVPLNAPIIAGCLGNSPYI